MTPEIPPDIHAAARRAAEREDTRLLLAYLLGVICGALAVLASRLTP